MIVIVIGFVMIVFVLILVIWVCLDLGNDYVDGCELLLECSVMEDVLVNCIEKN